MKARIFVFVLAVTPFLNAQTSDWRLQQVERELRDTNAQLAEINKRERAKEQAAAQAERERLLNMPLDEDLQILAKRYYNQCYNGSIRNPRVASETFDKMFITLAKIQDGRNRAKNPK